MTAPPAADAAAFLARIERDMVGGLQTFLALQVIAREKSVHGYALIRSMDVATGERGLWKEGTIYPLLANLEKEGLVISRWGDPDSGPRRKYYQLTTGGKQALKLARLTWTEMQETIANLEA